MILDSLLSQSPVLVFALSALLLAAYGAARLVRACVHRLRRPLAGH